MSSGGEKKWRRDREKEARVIGEKERRRLEIRYRGVKRG